MNSPDPILGSVIDGRYFVSARIARGGMATVYRATDQRLQRSVALKLIHPHLATQDNFTTRFIREARAAAKLNSPYIVNVHDQGIAETPDGQRAYLVMELVQGPNLRSQLSDHGSFPLGICLEITRQVLEALAVAHDNDIVHRDVKPENILLAEPLNTSAVVDLPKIQAKVADFGLARAASDPSATHTGTMLGTVAYVAPELVSEGKAGPPSDVYSTGIMLYELISGSLPYTGESPLSIAFAHVNQSMPRLSDIADWIPAGIDSLIGLLTAKSPERRPQSASAALSALEDIAASLPEESLIRRVPVFPTERRIERTEVGETNPDETSELPKPHSTKIIDLPRTASPPRELQPPVDSEHIYRSGHPHPTKILDVRTPESSHVTVRQRRRWWIPLLLFLVLALAIAGGAWWFFTMGPGQRVDIPDVTGMSVEEATSDLEALGLTVTETREFSDDVGKDIVMSSKPSASARVHPDESVILTISDGVEMLTVPDVAGMSQEDAISRLSDARFSPELTEAYSETIDKGMVIDQHPLAGESIAHDSTVTITVSMGREPISFPDVRGTSKNDAVDALENAGFTATVSEEHSDDVDEGLVISQSVTPGDTGFRGDDVTITVSLGPELVEVPDVFGIQEDEAVRILEEAGFVVNIEEDPFWGVIFGTVRSQTPSSGTMVRPGTEVTINIV